MNRKTASLLVAAAVLAGCVTAPPSRTVVAAPAPPSPPRVYFYPLQGQSEALQERDRYECYSWAVKQTGFDPSRHGMPREERATVVPARPPGEAVVAGAVAGAVVGAAVSGPGDAGKGAIIGAVAGSMLGSAAASAEAAEAARIEQRLERRGADSRYEREAAEYRRAMSACLEGRGYSVK